VVRVCFRRHSGKEILTLRISGFDPERKWSGLFCCDAQQSSALLDHFRREVDGATLASTKSTKARTFAGGRRREG
jgi:hypothetical protein